MRGRQREIYADLTDREMSRNLLKNGGDTRETFRG